MARKEKAILDSAQASLKAGELGAARRLLQSVHPGQLSRDHIAYFASLCRESGLLDLSLRALHNFIYPQTSNQPPASDAERMIYAATLIKVGAITEGLGILEGVSAGKNPKVLFYRAHGLIAQWEYETSIPVLSQYIQSSGITESDIFLGKLNLAAALVHERLADKAEGLLQELRKCASINFPLYHGATLELSAQNAITARDYKTAQVYLKEAEGQTEDPQSQQAFFIRKWKAVVRLLTQNKPNRAAFQTVRDEAVCRKHWETVRDCDFYWAVATRDRNLLNKLYFGTPFPSFKKRFSKELTFKFEFSNHYDWQISPGKGQVQTFLCERSSLEDKPVLYRLARLLTSDFYRPFSIGSLFSSVYLEEYYNVNTTPNRVHQLVHSLRTWFNENQIPLSVVSKKSLYKLIGKRPCKLRIPCSWEGSGKSAWLSQLQNDVFTIQDVMYISGSPKRTANRLLAKEIVKGTVRRTGAGKNTHYTVVQNKSSFG
ncbi:MAG: hypothetical protein HY537_03700 [Deltaproteobacteria bacterium]|nr:hypothetical protein [Deltaproteobacteria bacterium]